MGYSSYSSDSRSIRAEAMSYDTNSVEENFKSRSIQSAMNPTGLKLRESRDSDAHPNSVAIIIALDVTGSMLSVPQEMVKEGLPTIMSTIIQGGTPDPQVLFLGIGDHECDKSPLQVGQFESGDEELDMWLTQIYLERGGGSNDGESYMLAWYTAAFHTSIDCLEKRGQKGFLFTIGDEPVLPRIYASSLKKIFGDGQYQDWKTTDLLARAQEKYNVFHIHTRETGTGRRWDSEEKWKELLGQNLIVVENHTEIPHKIAEIVSKNTTEIPITIKANDETHKDDIDDIKML